MEFCIGREHPCKVVLGEKEPEAVQIAAENLRQDLIKVFGARVFCAEKDGTKIPDSGSMTGVTEIRIQTIPGREGWNSHKEAYRLEVRGGSLFISGSDRRGTIYGIYEFCERIGVSPWYFWADVPVKKKTEYVLEEGFLKTDHPSVEYRGIFINDEEELEAWVKNRMGEETIGVKTYEKIFELLLRLKANYIWPAMHVNSFNVKRENGALAERMGIVVGTSHCDMLMRSNNREWRPWLEKKGYTQVEYDYSLPGRNREILQEYWRESVEQNREFEVCYTLGMRGIHDSGFETRAFDPLEGEELKRAKIGLLQQVMEDQRQILKTTLGHLPLMTFVPYKEVLPLYDGGLKVPEDITLVWSNDNYGYIRRYPSKEEQERSGGNGIYYHNSYWAPPGMSYVFLCSIPLAHTAYELRKAYGEGIRKLWVINTGAMKPLEQEIEFFLRLAWEVGKENALTEDVDAYAEDWIDRNFSGGIGRETAGLLNDFSQLTNVRKLEMMEQNVFSQTSYGDEAVTRIHEYERLFAAGNRICEGLPGEERAAFFELVLMRIHAAYFTNLAYYYGDRSTLAVKYGRQKAAAEYVKRTRALEDARRRMILYYNTVMLGGKWKGILNPEGFPPPRAAMLPACTPPLGLREIQGKKEAAVTLWNEEEKLTFVTPGGKWFEIGCRGAEKIEFAVRAPEWLRLSQYEGSTETEARVAVCVDEIHEDRQGTIIVTEKDLGRIAEIPVEIRKLPVSEAACEDGGLLYVRAEDAESLPGSFRKIARVGRGGGALVEYCGEKAGNSSRGLSYRIVLTSSGEFLMEIHRFPSLNSVGRIRIGVSLDGGEILTVETVSRDEHLGNWQDNVRNNVDRIYVSLPYAGAGEHTVTFYGIDRYFAFSGFAIYTGERKQNNLAGAASRGDQRLPLPFDAETFAKAFYGEIPLGPRPVEYARVERETDTLVAADFIGQEEEYAEKVDVSFYLEKRKSAFPETDGSIRIDAATVLSDSASAHTEGAGWSYVSSESYGRSGLAMYLPALTQETSEAGTGLHYRIACTGGAYTLWLLAMFGRKEESCFAVGVDGGRLDDSGIYNQGSLWRYEAEQIYRWVPAAKLELTEGQHDLALYSLGAGLRIDRLYLTKGSERPPMDSEWVR